MAEEEVGVEEAAEKGRTLTLTPQENRAATETPQPAVEEEAEEGAEVEAEEAEEAGVLARDPKGTSQFLITLSVSIVVENTT